jgi:peptidoglycan/xylan/chitin deacetylase (PgdA/CDA1 family)
VLLFVVVILLAVAALSVAGLTVLRRPPDQGASSPASASASTSASSASLSASSASPSASPASTPVPSGSAATASPTLSASPSQEPGELPPRPDIVAHPQPVPVLIYHRIMEKPKGPPLVVMSTRLFRAQMAWLARNGYQPVTMRRVYDAWTGEGKLPPKAIVLSFDDGYADQVRNAAPVLRGYGWPGELALVSTALYLGDDPPATSLTPEMVQGLLDDGWGLESHSATHPDLTRLWGKKLAHQLVDSRERLEKLFEVKVDFFCYPGGIYNKRIKAAVRRHGYLAATATRYAAATPRDLFSMGRIYAYGGESMASFESRLREVLAAED